MHSASASSEHFAQQAYANQTLAPQPSAIKPDDTPSKPPIAPMEVSMAEAEELPSIDEATWKEYAARSRPARLHKH